MQKMTFTEEEVALYNQNHEGDVLTRLDDGTVRCDCENCLEARARSGKDFDDLWQAMTPRAIRAEINRLTMIKNGEITEDDPIFKHADGRVTALKDYKPRLAGNPESGLSIRTGDYMTMVREIALGGEIDKNDKGEVNDETAAISHWANLLLATIHAGQEAVAEEIGVIGMDREHRDLLPDTMTAPLKTTAVVTGLVAGLGAFIEQVSSNDIERLAYLALTAQEFQRVVSGNFKGVTIGGDGATPETKEFNDRECARQELRTADAGGNA